MKTKTKEMVNHPSHYQSNGGIEVIDVIESFDLGFNLGNVVKYILRCGKKDESVQELEKAKWYLEREIGNRRKQNSIAWMKKASDNPPVIDKDKR